MKKGISISALVAAVGTVGTAGAFAADAQGVLSGDTRLACEAILCLSSGTRPNECSPSLSRYFGIKRDKWSDTVHDRVNFLEKCPVANQTEEMGSLVSAMSRGAGRCDAAGLNKTLVLRRRGWADGKTYISNEMPDYCASYTGHAYTDFNSGGYMPKYVGTPERGGYWVEGKDYEHALVEYNARIQAEDRAQGQADTGNRVLGRRGD